MDCNTPGFPVYHQFPEFSQTYVHWVGDAIQPSYPLLALLHLPAIFLSIRVFSQASWLVESDGQSIGASASASVLQMSIQGWFSLRLTGLISLLSKQLSRVYKQLSYNFMPAVTVHSDFGAQENKVSHCFYCFPIYLLWSDGTGCHDLSFLDVELSQLFHCPLSLSSKDL